MEFPFKPADTKAYNPLPTEDEMIQFLDEINYSWEKTKIVSVVKHGRMCSEFRYLFAHFIQCLSSKVGSHDQVSTIHVQMVYSVIKNRMID